MSVAAWIVDTVSHMGLIGYSLLACGVFSITASLAALTMAGRVDVLKHRVNKLEARLSEKSVDLDRLELYFPVENDVRISESEKTEPDTEKRTTPNRSAQSSGIFKPREPD